jgi:glycosyltransferase involved in cell wall biosynthesis
LAEIGQTIFLIGSHPSKYSIPSDINLIKFPEYVYLRKISFPLKAYLTRKTIQSLKPDIIHAIGGGGSSWLAGLSDFHPYIITITGSDINLFTKKSLFYKRLTRDSLRNANGIICVSKDLKNKLISLDITGNKNIFILPFGVNTRIFRPAKDKQSIREKYNINHTSVVISIRAIQRIYNPMDIAMSIPEILDSCPDTLFLIFIYNKDEKLFKDFKVEIERSKTSTNVRYIEKIDNEQVLSEMYQSADAAISVPKMDGTPMSVLECMACGTPVVVSDLPSLREWIIDYENGLIVQPGDIKAISNSINYLLKNKKFAQSIGNNASQTIHKRGNLNDWSDQIMNIYDKVISG